MTNVGLISEKKKSKLKKGKKEYIQIKFIANLRGKKPAKLGLIANLAQLKNVTNNTEK